MRDFYNCVASGIHAMFEQEMAEFIRPAYEKYVKQYATRIKTKDETKYELDEKIMREREGIIIPLPTDSPQRPPNRKKIA